MELLSPSFGVFFWQLVAILLVIFILGRFAFKPIVDSIESRKQNIDNSLIKARDIDNKLRYIEELKLSVEKEVNVEKKKMFENIERMRKNMIDEMQKDVSNERMKMLEKVKNEIENEREKFSEECNVKINNIALNFVRRYLVLGVGNEEKKNFFLDESVRNFSKKVNE